MHFGHNVGEWKENHLLFPFNFYRFVCLSVDGFFFKTNCESLTGDQTQCGPETAV